MSTYFEKSQHKTENEVWSFTNPPSDSPPPIWSFLKKNKNSTHFLAILNPFLTPFRPQNRGLVFLLPYRDPPPLGPGLVKDQTFHGCLPNNTLKIHLKCPEMA